MHLAHLVVHLQGRPRPVQNSAIVLEEAAGGLNGLQKGVGPLGDVEIELSECEEWEQTVWEPKAASCGLYWS